MKSRVESCVSGNEHWSSKVFDLNTIDKIRCNIRNQLLTRTHKNAVDFKNKQTVKKNNRLLTSKTYKKSLRKENTNYLKFKKSDW